MFYQRENVSFFIISAFRYQFNLFPTEHAQLYRLSLLCFETANLSLSLMFYDTYIPRIRIGSELSTSIPLTPKLTLLMLSFSRLFEDI